MARPREFDPDQASRDLMQVFWCRGYEGTSLQDIEAATKLNKQSLYRVFGDKRGMYIAALEAYERNEITEAGKLLHQSGGAYERFDRLFTHFIEEAAESDGRWGCFLCNASVDQAPLDPEAGRQVAAMMARVQSSFEAALVASSEFTENTDDCRSSARMLMAGYFGLRVLTKAGWAKEALFEAKAQLLAPLKV